MFSGCVSDCVFVDGRELRSDLGIGDGFQGTNPQGTGTHTHTHAHPGSGVLFADDRVYFDDGRHYLLFWGVDVSGDALKNFSLSHEAHLEPLIGSDRTHQHILQRLATSSNFIFTPKDLAMIWLFELHSTSDEGLVYT